MVLSGAPFLVPQHEHDVDLAIATIIPLIFLTALLPELSDDPRGKQFQYVMRALMIVAGFAALVTAFLQLAGQETTVGTISAMVLLLITSIFAICVMAWPIVVGMGKFSESAIFLALMGLTFFTAPLWLGAYIIEWIFGTKAAETVVGYATIAIYSAAVLVFAPRLFFGWIAQRRKRPKSQAEKSSSDT
jgi:hypothetical protein